MRRIRPLETRRISVAPEEARELGLGEWELFVTVASIGVPLENPVRGSWCVATVNSTAEINKRTSSLAARFVIASGVICFAAIVVFGIYVVMMSRRGGSRTGGSPRRRAATGHTPRRRAARRASSSRT